MTFYPIHVRSSTIQCLVVGGGTVATRKVGGLLDADIRPVIIAPLITPTLAGYIKQHGLKWEERVFGIDDTEGFTMVIAATNNIAVNQHIAELCHQKNIMIDDVSSPHNSTFIIPAAIRKGDLLLTISTSGNVPFLTQRLKRHIESRLSDDVPRQIEALRACRNKIIEEANGDDEKKQQLFDEQLEPLVAGFLREMFS